MTAAELMVFLRNCHPDCVVTLETPKQSGTLVTVTQYVDEIVLTANEEDDE